MTGIIATVDAPMMALVLMLWLLAAGLLVAGTVAFAKWLLRRRGR